MIFYFCWTRFCSQQQRAYKQKHREDYMWGLKVHVLFSYRKFTAQFVVRVSFKNYQIWYGHYHSSASLHVQLLHLRSALWGWLKMLGFKIQHTTVRCVRGCVGPCTGHNVLSGLIDHAYFWYRWCFSIHAQAYVYHDAIWAHWFAKRSFCWFISGTRYHWSLSHTKDNKILARVQFHHFDLTWKKYWLGYRVYLSYLRIIQWDSGRPAYENKTKIR